MIIIYCAKNLSVTFLDEIDKALNNQLKSNTQIKVRENTPQILVKNGVKDLPMLVTQKHIKSIIYTLEEAKKLKLSTKNTNYHGLGKELFIKAIDSIETPKAIYQKDENNYIIVTEFKDKNNKDIIVPIQINARGRYNDIFIEENQIKSVYGRRNLKNYVEKSNFVKVYKKEELDFNERVQYSNVANSSTTDIIAFAKIDVNSNRYFMLISVCVKCL